MIIAPFRRTRWNMTSYKSCMKMHTYRALQYTRVMEPHNHNPYLLSAKTVQGLCQGSSDRSALWMDVVILWEVRQETQLLQHGDHHERDGRHRHAIARQLNALIP